MESIKIAVVDDHRLVREGLTLLLKSKGFQLVFSASTGKQAIVLMGRVTFSPDVILMDINMPEMNGYAACEKIHESYPECKILMLSSYTGPAFVGKAGRCNCHGFLSKGSSVESLVNAIQEVHQNGVYLNEFLNEKDFYHSKDEKEDYAHIMNLAQAREEMEFELGLIKLPKTKKSLKWRFSIGNQSKK